MAPVISPPGQKPSPPVRKLAARKPGSRTRRTPLPRGLTRRGESYVYRDQRNGKNVRISLGTDYNEALKQYAELKSKGLPAPQLTVSGAVERWLETRIKTGRNAKGQRLARVRAERYLNPYMGRSLLSKVRPDDLRNYRIWLEAREPKLSPTTVAWILGDARSRFAWVEETGLIDRSPFPKRLLPRLQQQPPDRLTAEEEAAVRGIPEPYAFVIRFLLSTGLRWAEACRAQAKDVRDGMLMVAHTKSGKIRRRRRQAGRLADERLDQKPQKVKYGPLRRGNRGGPFSKSRRSKAKVREIHGKKGIQAAIVAARRETRKVRAARSIGRQHRGSYF